MVCGMSLAHDNAHESGPPREGINVGDVESHDKRAEHPMTTRRVIEQWVKREVVEYHARLLAKRKAKRRRGPRCV